MENLSFGQIFFLILFFVVPLITSLINRVRRFRDDQTSKERALMQLRQPAQEAQAPAQMPRGSRNNRLREAQQLTVATAPSKATVHRRSLLENKRDVQRGFIMMTIFGPCRTFDP
jgi:hypothetical protein